MNPASVRVSESQSSIKTMKNQIETTPEQRIWSPQLRYIMLVMLVIIGTLFLILLKDQMTLIIVSLSIAFVLMPLIGFFQKRLRLPRAVAVLIAYVLGLAFLALISTLIIPALIDRITDFANQDWPAVFDSVDQWLADLIRQLEVENLQIGSQKIDLTVPLVEVRNWFNSLGSSKIDMSAVLNEWSTILSSAFSIGKNVFSTLLSLITVTMISIHVANDGEKLQGKIVAIFKPQYHPEVDELLTQLRHVWTKFFAGELKLMAVIGIMTTVFCYALGLKWALLLGIIAGFLEIIPNIGPIISAIPALFAAAVFGSSYYPLDHWLVILITLIGYVLIQQFENAIIVPRIMSNAVGVHPVILIIGILVLSSKFGVLGALLAAPLLGMVKVFSAFVLAKLREEDPYPYLYAASGSEADIRSEN